MEASDIPSGLLEEMLQGSSTQQGEDGDVPPPPPPHINQLPDVRHLMGNLSVHDGDMKTAGKLRLFFRYVARWTRCDVTIVSSLSSGTSFDDVALLNCRRSHRVHMSFSPDYSRPYLEIVEQPKSVRI